MELATVRAVTVAEIHTNNLNLDIDLNKTFTERVDLDETRINSTIESTEFGDQTNVTLRNRLVWVGAADAARKSTHSSDAGTKSVDCRCQL